MFVFKAMLKQLYTNGSLRNTDDGFRFELKNRLIDAQLTGVRRLAVDGAERSLAAAALATEDGRVVTSDEVSAAAPLAFDVGATFEVRVRGAVLAAGTHAVEIAFDSVPFGALTLEVEDVIG